MRARVAMSPSSVIGMRSAAPAPRAAEAAEDTVGGSSGASAGADDRNTARACKEAFLNISASANAAKSSSPGASASAVGAAPAAEKGGASTRARGWALVRAGTGATAALLAGAAHRGRSAARTPSLRPANWRTPGGIDEGEKLLDTSPEMKLLRNEAAAVEPRMRLNVSSVVAGYWRRLLSHAQIWGGVGEGGVTGGSVGGGGSEWV